MSDVIAFAAPRTAADILAMVDEPPLAVSGDLRALIGGVAAFAAAGPGAMAFLREAGADAARSPAALLIVPEAVERPIGCTVAVAEPMRWFVKALTALLPPSRPVIDPQATVAIDASLGEGVSVGAHAVVGAGCHIGAGTVIGAGAVLHPGVVIGQRCRIGANCVVGEAGLAMVKDVDGRWLGFPHVAGVRIGDEVELGSACSVVRGMLGDTVVEDGVKIGNRVTIGHNCRVGMRAWISSNAVLCGSVVVEPEVMVGASATINNHVVLGTGCQVGLGSVVVRAVPAGQSVFGVPAKPLPTMRKL